MRKKTIIAFAILLALIIGLMIFKKDHVAAPKGQLTPQSVSLDGTDDTNFSKYTIDNQNSIYFIVNKKRSLPNGFVPKNLVAIGGEQLRSDAANALNQLMKAAQDDGINLKVISGYRSYAYQQGVYVSYVKKDGVAKADTYSARPGHSEHQLGLAADVGSGTCDLQICFGETKAGKWLVNNAFKYGFIIRYPKGKENLTGYQYEPWHLRYLGIDLASQVQKSGKTLEQFFGLPASTSY